MGQMTSPLMKTAITALLFSGILAGCGGVPERDSILSEARNAYMSAKNDPEVASKAQTALYDAERALQRAEAAETAEEMQHLAYLAQRQAEIAQAVADRKTAEAARAELSEQKGEVVLMSRERELAEKSLEVDQKAREAEQARREAEQLLAQNRALQEQIKELQGRETERGIVLTLGDVLFETGKADLLASANNNLNKIAAFLNENPDRNVLIEGHTDNVGTDANNVRLSERRAESTRIALVQRGVSPQRIITRGFGESRPVESNDTVTGRQKNRRVEITILNKGEQLRW